MADLRTISKLGSEDRECRFFAQGRRQLLGMNTAAAEGHDSSELSIPTQTQQSLAAWLGFVGNKLLNQDSPQIETAHGACHRVSGRRDLLAVLRYDLHTSDLTLVEQLDGDSFQDHLVPG